MDPTNLDELRRAREKRDEREHAKRDTEESDIRWLMGSRRGRRIARRILDRAGVFRLSFHENAAITAFNEGRRNEGLYLTELMNRVCPELFVLMMQERGDDNRSSKHANDPAAGQ